MSTDFISPCQFSFEIIEEPSTFNFTSKKHEPMFSFSYHLEKSRAICLKTWTYHLPRLVKTPELMQIEANRETPIRYVWSFRSEELESVMSFDIF